jgi:hypothetical protein
MLVFLNAVMVAQLFLLVADVLACIAEASVFVSCVVYQVVLGLGFGV